MGAGRPGVGAALFGVGVGVCGPVTNARVWLLLTEYTAPTDGGAPLMPPNDPSTVLWRLKPADPYPAANADPPTNRDTVKTPTRMISKLPLVSALTVAASSSSSYSNSARSSSSSTSFRTCAENSSRIGATPKDRPRPYNEQTALRNGCAAGRLRAARPLLNEVKWLRLYHHPSLTTTSLPYRRRHSQAFPGCAGCPGASTTWSRDSLPELSLARSLHHTS
jgi:hypothetical protein